jgi:hypothetical protein
LGPTPRSAKEKKCKSRFDLATADRKKDILFWPHIEVLLFKTSRRIQGRMQAATRLLDVVCAAVHNLLKLQEWAKKSERTDVGSDYLVVLNF